MVRRRGDWWQVNSDKSKVAVFIVVGILMAGAVGALVWRTGTPTSPSVSDTATTSQLSSTSESTDALAVPAALPTTPGIGTSVTEAAPPPPVDAHVTTPRADDPFLAPNAVVVLPERDAPTTVYRPENIGDQVPDATDGPSVLASPATAEDGQEPAPETASGTPVPEDQSTTGAASETLTPEGESPEPTPATATATATETTETTPGAEAEIPESDEAVESLVDSLPEVPTLEPTGEPTEPIGEPTGEPGELEPSPTTLPEVSVTAPEPEPAPAPAPTDQNLQGTTPDSGSGSVWSWSTFRNLLSW